MTKKTQTKPKLQAAENPTFERFIGVNPGRDGAIAVLDENAALLYVGDAKSAENFALDLMEAVLRDAMNGGAAVCAVEKPVAMPGIHGSVLITLTLAAGAAIGAAHALGLHCRALKKHRPFNRMPMG